MRHSALFRRLFALSPLLRGKGEAPHFPVNTGLRFSMNARRPSM